jgi:hypothetical protein
MCHANAVSHPQRGRLTAFAISRLRRKLGGPPVIETIAQACYRMLRVPRFVSPAVTQWRPVDHLDIHDSPVDDVEVGRSSPAGRRACTPGPGALGTRAARDPKTGCRRLLAGPPAIPLPPAPRPGMTHRDRQSMRRWTKSTHIDYFALSVPRFAARAWLQSNLLCVLGEVISEREADLVHGV